METQAPEVTNSVTVGQVVIPTPIATPTLSPAYPPPLPPYYETPTPMPYTEFPFIPPVPGVEPPPKRFVGKPLVIYGYGPANSSVGLVGIGVSESTVSDHTGYFVFSQVYSHSLTYPELCIQAVDTEKRVTQPSCIPALSESAIIPTKVGPVILSPTISIESNNVLAGEEVVAEGVTIPNSQVSVHMAKEEGYQLSLVNNVYAYNIPTYQIKSNEKGEFEFSLPTQDSARYTLFASSVLGDSKSAKSNTLNFSVLTKTQSYVAWTKNQLINNKLAWFIVFEIIVIIVLVIAILKSSSKPHRQVKRKQSKK